MKIGFATDTNILKKQNLHDSEKVLNATDIYTEYIEALKNIKSNKELIYFMPEIVVEELLMQKEVSFNETYESFERKYNENSYGLLGELPQNNIKEKLKQEREEYNSKYKLITLEYTAELMEILVKDALMKKAPFDKSVEGRKTDAGFKDALIWKTIVQSADIDECDEFYFFTSDKAFVDGEQELIKEFKEKHQKTKIDIIYIENDGSHRQNSLNYIIDKHGLYKTDVIELYDKNLVKRYFDKISYIPNDIDYYCEEGMEVELTQIKFEEFGLDEFNIDNVEKNEETFNIYCSFRTLKYNLDKDVENRKHIIGNVKFNVKSKTENYEYVKSEVSKVDFDLGVIDLLRGFNIGLGGSVAAEISKIVKENILNIESFKVLKDFQDVVGKRNKEQMEMLQAISNPLKDIKIPQSTNIANKLKNNIL